MIIERVTELTWVLHQDGKSVTITTANLAFMLRDLVLLNEVWTGSGFADDCVMVTDAVAEAGGIRLRTEEHDKYEKRFLQDAVENNGGRIKMNLH